MKDNNSNSSLYDEPNGTSSNIPGNETSSLLQDELTHSPVSLMFYGGVLVLFVCIPLGMEFYNYLTGRGLYLFRTSTETVHPESKEQSVGNGKKSRLMTRLEQNSRTISASNFLTIQNGTFLDDNTEPSVLEEGLGVGCGEHSEERDKDNDATTDASTLDPTTTSPSQSILECAICMESYNIGDTVVWSLNPNCHHVFHTTCIYKWLRLKPESQWKCPYCRQSFVLPLEKTATTDT